MKKLFLLIFASVIILNNACASGNSDTENLKDSWSYTRLGKVDGVTQAELKNILGKGDVTAVFEILR